MTNVIVIYTDDLGFGDVGFTTGGQGVRTPHLDALAASGAAMLRWYANSPVCSPSRASLFTGKHPAHAGVDDILGAKRGCDGLPAQDTVAAIVSRAGYRTALLGKWHLGTSATSSPVNMGFDDFFGFLAGCVDYYSHIMYWDQQGFPTHDLWQESAEVWHNGEYLTTMLSQRAVQVIEQAEAPFFLTVSYNAPHYPLHAPSEYFERHADLPPDRRMIAAMISAVDDGVGDIVAALERTGQRSDTVIFFSSDNGPSTEERNWLAGEEIAFAGGSSGGLRGSKGSLFEGGIRVPALWSWPGTVPAGLRLTTPCQMSDVMPTVLEALGLARPEDLDGRSVWPLLSADHELEPRVLCWEYDGQTAASDGRFKLVRQVREHLGGPTVVETGWYDLVNDPGESQNLLEDPAATANQELLALSAALDDFEESLQAWRAHRPGLQATGP